MTKKQLARHMVEIAKRCFWKDDSNSTIHMGNPTLRNKEELVDSMSAIIGITGSMSALIYVYCSRDAALQIASVLLGEEISEINEEVLDAIGELANMLGGAKERLTKAGRQLEFTVPFVIAGDRYTVKRPMNAMGVQIPFLLDGKNRFEFTIIVR